MKLISQIGTHTPAHPPLPTRLRSMGRRIKWGYVAWAVMFLVTVGIALYAVHAMVHIMNRALSL